MDMKKACLFGGTLFAAGMANAQSFTFLDGGVTAYGYFAPSYAYVFAGYDTSVVAYEVAFAPDDLALSVSGYGSTSFTERTSNTIHIESVWDGTEPTFIGDRGYAGGFIAQFFTVDEDAILEITWDLAGSDHWQSFIGILDAGNPVLDFAIEDENITGSTSYDVRAGEEYLVLLYLGVPFIDDANKPIYMNAELLPLPSPASASLLLLSTAGCASRRRRR